MGLDMAHEKTQSALSIEKLSHSYGTHRALVDVNLEVYPGEVFGLLGPNGAGKTTLISNLVTLQQPTQGRLKVFGIDVVKRPKQAKAMIGFVPQELVHHGFFTALEVLRYHAMFYGVKRSEADLKELLSRLQLWTHRHKLVNQLSGGMKRRLLIAKALLHRPKLLLLDEPTAGVDVELRLALWKFIGELKESGMAILLTTHYLEEAERLCDRIGILERGQLKRIDCTKQLLREHSSKKVTFILTQTLPKVTHPLVKSQGEFHIDFHMPNEMPLLQVIEEVGIPFNLIQDINVKVGTLEDVMENVLNDQ